MGKITKFVLLTFPMLFVLLAFFRSGSAADIAMLEELVPLTDGVVYNLFERIFEINSGTTSDGSFNYLCWLFTYLVYYVILDIVFHVIAFLPRLGKKFIHDATGGDF